MKWMSSSAIVVDITTSLVTFTEMDGTPVSLAPIVYVAPDQRRNRLTAGTPPPESAVRVEVFGPGPAPLGVSKFDCLVALFSEGLKAILDRSFFRLRPEVLVRGAETLAPALGGYERALLARALEQAGARRVRWPDEFDGHAERRLGKA